MVFKWNTMNALQIMVAALAGIQLVISLETGYLSTSCNAAKLVTESFRLESSTGIVYKNNMDCTFTVSVPNGKRVLVLFRQFELENADAGLCADYVNFHDGPSGTATTLNSNPLCSNSPPDNVTSSNNEVTLHLVTDATAVFRGFELLFVTFSYAPCDGETFSCSSGICVASSSRCDGFDQCGDNSDEADCQVPESQTYYNYTGLITGLVLLFLLLVFIGAVVGVHCYRKRRIKRILRELLALPHIPIKEPAPSYPVTEKYNKKQFSFNMNRKDHVKLGNFEQFSGSKLSMSSSILRTPDS